jgi:hypothetical protein
MYSGSVSTSPPQVRSQNGLLASLPIEDYHRSPVTADREVMSSLDESNYADDRLQRVALGRKAMLPVA